MGYLTGTVFSESLNMDTDIGVILPHDSRYHRGFDTLAGGRKPRARPKTLLLLHGLTDNHNAWYGRTRLMFYAEQRDVAVVMADGVRSFYQDMRNGEAYFTYICDELPRLMETMFNVSCAPEDLLVAGLSMGGYGALKCVLTHPERFAAAGAFSSAIHVEKYAERIPDRVETRGFDRVVRGIFGEKPDVPAGALPERLAEKAFAGGKVPPIFMTCGTEDALLPENEAFFDSLTALGADAVLEKWPGGHEWAFWDKSLRMFLDRFA